MGRSVDGKGIQGGCEVEAVGLGLLGFDFIGRDITVLGNSVLSDFWDLGLTHELNNQKSGRLSRFKYVFSSVLPITSSSILSLSCIKAQDCTQNFSKLAKRTIATYGTLPPESTPYQLVQPTHNSHPNLSPRQTYLPASRIELLAIP